MMNLLMKKINFEYLNLDDGHALLPLSSSKEQSEFDNLCKLSFPLDSLHIDGQINNLPVL